MPLPPTARTGCPILVVAATTAAYLGSFAALYPLLGPGVCALSLVPVIAAGWCWGRGAGLLASVVLLAGNTALLNLGAEPGGWAAVFQSGGGPGAAALVMAGIGAGWVRRQFGRLAQVEEALRRSEARKAAVLETAPDAVIAIDHTGAVLEFNAAAQALFGYRREEALGRPLAELVVPDCYRGDHERGLALCVATGEGTVLGKRMELAARRKDGSEFPAEVTVTRADALGPPVFIGFVRDLTHWKHAQQTLRESEERYRCVVEQAADAIFVLDPAGRFVDVNRRACESLGYARDELLGMTMADIDGEDRRTDLRPGDTATLECRHRRKDGTTFPVEVRVGLLEAGDGRLKIALARDVTRRRQADAALRESERRFRETLESARLIAVWLDPVGRVTFCNDALLALTGYRRDEVVGRNWFDAFVPEPERETIKARYARNVRSGQLLTHFENEIVTRSGERRLISWSNTVLRDPDGRPVGANSLGEDVTERRRTEAALRQSEERFRALIEKSYGAVCLLDIDGTVRYVSPSVERIAGRAPAELVGHNAFEWSHPDDLAAVREPFDRFRAEPGATITYRHRFRHTDGSWRWVEVTLTNLLRDPAVAAVVCNFHDVTERVRADEALRESEERYRRLFEESPIGIYRSTPDGRILLANPVTVRLSGCSSFEDLATRNLERDGSCAGYDRAQFKRRLEAEGEVRGIETTWTGRDGRVAYVRENARAVRGPGGEVLYYEGTLEDVTDRKRAEEAVLRAEERYRAFIANSTEGIWRMEFDPPIDASLPADEQTELIYRHGRLAECNDAFARMYGYERADELVGRGVDAMLPPSDERCAEYLRAVVRAGYRVTDAESVEYDRDGNRKYFANSMAGVVEGGKLLRAWGTQRDVTDRKRAEEALREREELLRAIIDHIPCGVFWKDRDSVYLGCNHRVARDFGSDSPDQLVGRTDRSICPDPAEAEFYMACDRRVMEAGEPMLGIEEVQTRPDGSKAVLLTSKVPLRDAAGAVVGVLGVYQDVTDRKLLEEQYRQAQKMEAVGRLAGGVAHDFNNLLTVINGFSQLLLASLPERHEARSAVEEIGKAGERAANLTRQLLAFSRKQMLQPRVLDLNALVADMARMLPRLLGEDVELRTTLAPDLPRIKADPGQVEQVVMNLVVNSRDAMPRGGKLTIETADAVLDEGYCRNHPGLRPGRYVLLAVSDTGSGMDPATLARVFEPFFTTKEQGKGTGLGLATVYGIVQQTNGHVAAYSEVGIGTTFKVYLPATDEARPASVAGPAATPGGRETVLLVEDEESVRSLARRLLHALGYHVLEASSGPDALRLAAAHRGGIDLLLTDVVMPRMSGRELADRLAEARPGVKVLYMSGYTDDAVVRHGVLEEGVAFLQKPFPPAALATRVREVLDRPPHPAPSTT